MNSSQSNSFQAIAGAYKSKHPASADELNPYRRKLFLVIDSVPEMQRALAMTLGSFGAERVEYASRGNDALAKLARYDFDVVLCDYDLGNGYDGLYLFEEARERNLLKQSCVFMIVTGERRAQRVISAAEMAPDEYLLKPFTGEELRLRLERAIRRREAFRVVDDALMRFEYMAAAEACNKQIQDKNEFALDFMRLKGNLSLKIGDWDSAKKLYVEVLRLKPLPWARLGLAKALTGLKSYDEARMLFEQVLQDNDRVMEAYDWLAKIHLANHDGAQAQLNLQQATCLSPAVVRRQKQLGEVAFANGDLATAEAACSTTLTLAKHSWHRQPALYAQLARVQLAQRDSVAAGKTLAGLRRDYKHDDAGNWVADVIDSQLQQQAGNKSKAAQLLASAAERLPQLEAAVGVEARMEYARACYSLARPDLGDAVARTLVRNHHDDEALLESLGCLFDQVGRTEAGRELIAENVQSVVNLNNAAVREAQAGRYEQAVSLFGKAYAELPDNVQVMLNTSNAIIALVYRQGWHESHVRAGHAMLGRVRALQPSSSKFQKILQAWNSLMEQQGRREWLV